MGVSTGDISPRASGSAAIGVEMTNGMGGFTTDITPYAHVHMNSGVWHDPLHGQSGVLRFNQDVGFEISIDGGLTFNRVSLGLHTLQDAYDGGDEIDVKQFAGGLHGPLVKQPETYGRLENYADLDLIDVYTNYAIGVSGSARDINNPDSYAFTAINAGNIILKGSGTSPSANPAHTLFVGFEEGDGESHIATLQTSGILRLRSDQFMSLQANEAGGEFVTRGDLTLQTETADGGFVALNSVEDIYAIAGVSLGAGTGGQIFLQPFNASGELQYRFGPHQSWHMKRTHSTTSGPDGDGFEPLVPSGSIVQMILENAPGATPHTLQAAYDGGNEIDIDPGVEMYRGVLLKETFPGHRAADPDDVITDQNQNYGIAVSGHTLTPDNVNSYSFARLNSNALVITSSGTGPGVAEAASTLFIGYEPDDVNKRRSVIETSGTLDVNADNNMTFRCGGIFDFLGESNMSLSTTGGQVNITNSAQLGNIDLLATRGDILLRAGTENNFGGQVTLKAFSENAFVDASGLLEYRFGPHQSWYMKTSHSDTSGPFGDGFNPLVPSGQILQMILENAGGGGSASTLQEAYEGGNHVITDNAEGGAVSILGTDSMGLRIDQADDGTTYPHMQLSGVLRNPGGNTLERGALWMLGHTAGWESNYIDGTDPASYAEAQARSLGPALPFYDTGSGVTNLRVASGIAQFSNVASQEIDPTSNTVVDIFSERVGDAFYTNVLNSGIRFNVTGSYRVHADITFNKTGGNLRQTVLSSVRINDPWGQQFTFRGAEGLASLRDSATHQFASVGGTFIADIDVGDVMNLKFTLQGKDEGAPFTQDNTVAVFGTGANLLIEYLGPKRFGRLNRSKRTD